ncbi:MAG: sulfurtransferase TusA family protein [bacterium]|nr:sulfurtransferase TusA family protein [bacterium]
MQFYEVPDTLYAEQDKFELDIEEFKKGNIDPVKFKGIRVAHGVYEQRQPDTYMIRIRCAAGGITPTQLKKVAELGDLYGSGEVHFTTRQEVQVHDVKIDGVMPVIRGLNEVQLSSRGGGGNTIRNILTSPDSGVSLDEVFDVDPYAIALTTRMIHETDSWNLPRKFKIAFSKNSDDDSITQTTCLGFVAQVKDEQKGFAVYCAGGMGAKPMVGHELFDFVPDTKVYHVTKALKVMFDKHGNRRSKFSSRIKFLWKKLDREEFVRLFAEEYDKIKDDASLNLELPTLENAALDATIPVETAQGDAFELWKRRYVSAQKQAGLVSIKLPLVLGDLLRKDADKLSAFLAEFGENTIRCDRAQNMRLRNIPEAYLGNAFNIISKLEHTLVGHAPFIGNMINCTGAQTCKLGICLPRGLSSHIRERLTSSDLDLDAIPDFRLNMSGCPNTCGMHHIAHLGFFGKVGRKDGDMYPAYNVLTGGKVEMGHTQYAERQDELPVHFIPDFAHDFLKVWIDRKVKGTYDTYYDFLEAEGNDLVKSLCAQYKDVPTFDENPDFYVDFGAKKRLSMDEIGTAECSAGVFDMIDVDRKSIKNNTKLLDQELGAEEDAKVLYRILFSSARMLLVTRGLDANTDEMVFSLFIKHFIKTGIVSDEFEDVVKVGRDASKDELVLHKDKVLGLAAAMTALYESMDDSLRFKTKDGDVINEIEAAEEESSATPKSSIIEKDFRGVPCPMNFVKTKLVLEAMKSGEFLRIMLDDGEPIQNVPNSVKLEGHKVLSQTQLGAFWEVLIEKV